MVKPVLLNFVGVSIPFDAIKVDRSKIATVIADQLVEENIKKGWERV